MKCEKCGTKLRKVHNPRNDYEDIYVCDNIVDCGEKYIKAKIKKEKNDGSC